MRRLLGVIIIFVVIGFFLGQVLNSCTSSVVQPESDITAPE